MVDDPRRTDDEPEPRGRPDAPGESAQTPYDESQPAFAPRLGRYADASTHRSAQITPGVVAYPLDDRLFFANGAYVRARSLEAIDGSTTTTRWLVFDAEAVPTIDSTGTERLESS